MPTAHRLFRTIVAIGIAFCLVPASRLAASAHGKEAAPAALPHSEPRGPDPAPDARSDPKAANIQIVFFEFYGRPAALFINDKLFYRGVLKVEEATTGLSLISRAEARGPTVFRLTSGPLDTSVALDVTPRVRTIMINPLVAPHIWATETDSTLLD